MAIDLVLALRNITLRQTDNPGPPLATEALRTVRDYLQREPKSARTCARLLDDLNASI